MYNPPFLSLMPFEGGKGDFWLPSRLVNLYPLPLPFQSLGCILEKNPPPRTVLAFISFFTFRYRWFQKPISSYDSVLLERTVLCLFRSFFRPHTTSFQCKWRVFSCAGFSVVGGLDWLNVFILTRVCKWFLSPPPDSLLSSFFSFFFLPFLFLSSSFPSSTALPSSGSQDSN